MKNNKDSSIILNEFLNHILLVDAMIPKLTDVDMILYMIQFQSFIQQYIQSLVKNLDINEIQEYISRS